MRNWEFWPAWLTNIPVVGFWLFQAVKTGHLFFFSTVNPGAMNGGLLGNSKMKILDAIPDRYIPKSGLFKANAERPMMIRAFMRNNGMDFPVILKPDIGERGLLVQRIRNWAELDIYLNNAGFDVILQEYVDYALEVTILCYTIPGTDEKGITSVCEKEFLHIEGDGRRTILQLIRGHERGRLYEHLLKASWQDDWSGVPGKGETVYLQPIGNHCKGTKFINANHRIDQQLVDTFTGILDQMEGFHYGRFDLRCASWESLRAGKDFRILEFNGVNSEPAHVYDPGYPIVRKYRDFYRQWALMARIHRAQATQGIRPMKLRDAIRQGKRYFQYLQAVKSI